MITDDRKLAREWLIKHFDEDIQVPAMEHLDTLADLLRTVRLEEAKWWASHALVKDLVCKVFAKDLVCREHLVELEREKP